MQKLSILRLVNIVMLIALSSLFTRCKREDPFPPPVAFFTYYPNTNLIAPVTISFTNKSENADNYLWSYGTGQTDTDKDIVLTASSGGTYTITLTVTGKGGTDAYSRTITIANPTLQPTAGFTYSPSQNLVAPATVAFTNTSTNATSYKWDFSDGTTSTTASPTKQFKNDGTYTIKLTATGTGGSDVVSKNLVVAKAVATTGQAVFWTDKSSGWSSIDVTVGGTAAGSITGYNTSAPACGSSKVVTVTRSPGTYAFTAKSNTGVTWSGNTTITTNGCDSQKLNFPATTTNCDWSTYSNTTALGIETKWGTCGNDNSLSIKFTNKTNVKLVLYVAMERKDGSWDLQGDNPASGKTTSFWSCSNTGRYKYWAMASEVYAKNNCPVPKP